MAELDREIGGEGFGPKDLDRVDLPASAQVDHDPLRMQRIFFAGEVLVEIRIALPKTGRVAIINSRVTIIVRLVDGVAASRQTIAVAHSDRRAGLPVRCPIALTARRIAPASLWIPMPRLTCQLGSQSIGQRFESSGEHSRNVRRRKLTGGFSPGMTIDAGTQCVRGREAISRMAGREKHRHRCIARVLIAALRKYRNGLSQGQTEGKERAQHRLWMRLRVTKQRA